MGSCQYDTLTLTLTPLSLFLPEGRSANFASEPACPAPAHHEKPPSPPMAGATLPEMIPMGVSTRYRDKAGEIGRKYGGLWRNRPFGARSAMPQNRKRH